VAEVNKAGCLFFPWWFWFWVVIISLVVFFLFRRILIL